MTFFIVGAGGFGRETLDALRAASPLPACDLEFLDDHALASEVDGVRVRRPGRAKAGTFVVAIADPRARARLAAALLARGLLAGQVLHQRAVISPGAVPGPGCVVLAGAFVSTGALLGAHVQVNYNASVGHDSALGDFVTVLPGANIAGAVTLGASATVGSNACVLPGLRIGPAAALTTDGRGFAAPGRGERPGRRGTRAAERRAGGSAVVAVDDDVAEGQRGGLVPGHRAQVLGGRQVRSVAGQDVAPVGQVAVQHVAGDRDVVQGGRGDGPQVDRAGRAGHVVAAEHGVGGDDIHAAVVATDAVASDCDAVAVHLDGCAVVGGPAGQGD